MLFNSLVFLIFGALFFLFWWKLKKKSTTMIWGTLIFFSFIFLWMVELAFLKHILQAAVYAKSIRADVIS